MTEQDKPDDKETPRPKTRKLSGGRIKDTETGYVIDEPWRDLLDEPFKNIGD